MREARNAVVVPAKAGTHTPGRCNLGTLGNRSLND